MKKQSFNNQIDIETLLKTIEKIKLIDPLRGSYLSRHIVINEITNSIEYIGDYKVLKNTLDLIKISNPHLKNK